MAKAMPNTGTEIDVSVDSGTPAHYVDWGAIVAGAFIAAAISTVFLTFGSAIGLSMTSFQNANSTSVTGLVIAAALWLLWVQVSSCMGGGYVAGRMRRRIGDATRHEVEMRDGSHGLIVWAVAVLLGVVMTSWLAVAGIAGLANVAGEAASNSSSLDYQVDRLLRSETVAPATGSASTAPGINADTQPINRALARSVGAVAMDKDDKSYLVREISARTGLPAAEAEQRLDQTVATLKAQADKARRYGILIAFLTAASLLVSAVAAWWAAGAGGKHRDEGVDHSHLTRWR